MAPTLSLHTFFRSSSAGRLRIALALKKLPYEPTFVNLLANEQKTPEYLKLNPSGTVPLLVHTAHGKSVSIGQSIAALEYLEETFPDSSPLLPPAEDAEGRAFVREIVSVVVADMQPVTSLRLVAAVKAGGLDGGAWIREWTERGLQVCESIISRSPKPGKFCYGDAPTHADVCLQPALWNAVGAGIDLGKYPTTKKVFDNMEALSEVNSAHWSRQGDTPAEMRS
jgi:maleylacetoacetate isomerase